MKTFILSMAAMAALLVIEYIIISVIVCRKMTGTWNVRHFIFNHRYWSFSVLNYHFFLSRESDETVEAFIIKFTAKYLMPRKRNVIQKLREDERRLLIQILSNQDFILHNFGRMPLSLKRYKDMERAWEQETRRLEDGK